MNRQKLLITVIFLIMTGVTAGLIMHAGAHQKLGEPGVRTKRLPGSNNLQVILPPDAAGYTFQATTQAEIVVVSLPNDTSFGSGLYTAKDGFQSMANVVLMGTDRSSIHKPQVCLTAQGWKIDDAASKVEKIPMRQPHPYDLPVMHIKATQQIDSGGQPRTVSGVYVYWYVDATKFTAENAQLMWWMARDILLTGVLDRFSYIAYFSVCEPGQEDATYEKIKDLIVATVPQFQLVPGAPGGANTAGH